MRDLGNALLCPFIMHLSGEGDNNLNTVDLEYDVLEEKRRGDAGGQERKFLL